MFSHLFSLFRLSLLVLVVCSFLSPVSAGTQASVAPGLEGLTTVRVYFDVNVGIPKKLETRLRLINTTYDELVQQGIKPEFIVGFRGKASYFVTNGDGYVEPEALVYKKKIQQWVKTIKNRGIAMEQCKIAADLLGVELDDFLPEIKVVDNGYVSMIGYQHQGIAHIPMD